MTPMTMASPTIVRTIEPLDGPAECAGVGELAGRLSGVSSPEAAKAAGAVSKSPSGVAPSVRKMAGEVRIYTEGGEPGSGSDALSASPLRSLSGDLHQVQTPS